MSWIPISTKEKREMLSTIGVESFEELLSSIPSQIRLKRPLELPPPLSELEVSAFMRHLSEESEDLDHNISFLGGGSYDHWIPAAVSSIIERSEYYTAYTPYQAEVSQGTLQAIYEYQSLICELTEMDVANASVYDGASATAEAAIMSHSITERDTVLVSEGLNPTYYQVLITYTQGLGLRIRKIPLNAGRTDWNRMEDMLDERTASVIIQNPNFLGTVEDLSQSDELVHKVGALLVMVVDPISLGLLKPPGMYGADIAVGEGQSLGNPTSFGGPYLGFFTSREEFLRRMPGRLVGATRDRKGGRGFVLTLQTREQHIRREKATSNICTNQALNALAATVYLALVGREGMRDLALLCLQKSHYAQKGITKLDGFNRGSPFPFFKEFLVVPPLPSEKLIESLSQKGIFVGPDLNRFGMGDGFLVALTEKRSKEEIDLLIESLEELTRGGGRR